MDQIDGIPEYKIVDGSPMGSQGMPSSPLQSVVRHLRGALINHAVAEVLDAELLSRYVLHQDATAFDALLRRHGPMVLGVCRRLLRDEHDTEDAFQATFLILIRKANKIRDPAKLGNWLYGVAVHTAVRARAARALRRAKEAQVLPCEPRAEPPWSHLLPLLDQELERLPQKYRLAVVLCDLQGRTRKEVARELGCPEGTVASRLARARGLLARRLARLGVTVGSGAFGSLLSGCTDAGSLPPAWLTPLLRASCQGSLRTATSAGLVAPGPITLAEGVMGNMLFKTLVHAGVVLLMTGLAVTGMGLVLASAIASGSDENQPTVTQARLHADANAASTKQQQETPADPALDHVIEEKPTKLAGWGTVTDPSGDCAFTTEKSRLVVKVPGGIHDLNPYRSLQAPRVLKKVKGDFVAQIKVSGDFKPGEKAAGDHSSFNGAGLLVWQDEKNFIRLERNRWYVPAAQQYACYPPLLEYFKNGAYQGTDPDSTFEEFFKDLSTWLRLERNGDKLSASYSHDGKDWTEAKEITVDLPAELSIGIAAINTSEEAFTVEFDEYKVFIKSAEPMVHKSTPVAQQQSKQGDQASFLMGEMVQARFFLRNTGKAPLKVSYPRRINHGHYRSFRLLAQNGEPVAVPQRDQLPEVSGWFASGLPSGTYAEAEGGLLAIGDGTDKDAVDAVLPVSPGRAYGVQYTLPNYGGAKAGDLQTGTFRFRVLDKGTPARKEPTVSERDKLIAWGKPDKNGLQAGVLLASQKPSQTGNATKK
jgi:RNA polymerase sigma factor (sigma-70 family)